MSQSNLVNQNISGKKIAVSMKKMKITVPHFDNSELIQGYSKTLIGRCKNLPMQDMKMLLHMLPHIWKIEDRVAGADLGLGKFQFDFDREEDIAEVMKMEPFHFDYWMLSIVVIDGLQPLCFETIVEFHGGEETTVFLLYEKLFGYCRTCFSLCYDQKVCPNQTEHMEQTVHEDFHNESRQNSGAVTYKAAVMYGSHGVNGIHGNHEVGRNGSSTQSNAVQNRGKGKGYNHREEVKQAHMSEGHRYYKARSEQRFGEGSSRDERQASFASPKELQDQLVISSETAEAGKGLSEHERIMIEAVHNKDTEGKINKTPQRGKKVRKNLAFEDGEAGNKEAQVTEVETKKVFLNTAEDGKGLGNNEESVHDWEQLLANDDSLMDFEIEGSVAGNFQDAVIEQDDQMQLTSAVVKELMDQEEGEFVTTLEENEPKFDGNGIVDTGIKENT
ncbi:uncharacterized protein LOC112084510 [Eutrema salsugineum]|uniref:uncharacterized protein LOC112084510 n=1 Tax=Eutrema salsugineum TaxID=72664 RepID=UPI000CED645D|nr:uncharacterized protein LOC112084510 [Eutrema salsugineum]